VAWVTKFEEQWLSTRSPLPPVPQPRCSTPSAHPSTTRTHTHLHTLELLPLKAGDIFGYKPQG